MDAIEEEDICSRVKFRFSVLCSQNAVKDLSKKQRDILVKYGFDRLLELHHHTIYPTFFIMWIMDNMVAELAIFQFGSKRINFDKNTFQQFLGIPAGDIPAEMSSDNDDIIERVKILKEKYMTNNKIYIKRAIDLLEGDDDEESFMTSFMLVFLGTIVCPGTSDSVDWKFLFSLVDVSKIPSIDWLALCLQWTVNEVAKYKRKIADVRSGKQKQMVYVGGCLSSMAVAYMDMLDLNPGAGQYTLDYGVPRIYHVCSSDFKFVTQFDRNHLASSYEYGLLDFRDKACTPYSEIAIEEANVLELKRHELALDEESSDMGGLPSDLKNTVYSIVKSLNLEYH